MSKVLNKRISIYGHIKHCKGEWKIDLLFAFPLREMIYKQFSNFQTLYQLIFLWKRQENGIFYKSWNCFRCIYKQFVQTVETLTTESEQSLLDPQTPSHHNHPLTNKMSKFIIYLCLCQIHQSDMPSQLKLFSPEGKAFFP